MKWFGRQNDSTTSASSADQAVIVHYALSDDEHGTVEEREAIFALEDRLAAIIETQGLGEHDGNEFGAGEAAIYCYGPDAGLLFAAIEGELRAFPARPAFVHLRYGDVSDVDAREERVEL
jgi:hypothetical protein